MLERLGLIAPEQAEDIRREQEKCPEVDTDDILREIGYVSDAEIEAVTRVPSMDLNGPTMQLRGHSEGNGSLEPTTEEIELRLVQEMQLTRNGMDKTITTGIRLSDIADAIAAKKAGGTK